mmetsp:Transcript_13056/g.16230  ORF Transcript_13056/g.16230 Transcript_13056/m.16230 type:complete len:108 (-) Transcript_13056:621-944(-)
MNDLLREELLEMQAFSQQTADLDATRTNHDRTSIYRLIANLDKIVHAEYVHVSIENELCALQMHTPQKPPSKESHENVTLNYHPTYDDAQEARKFVYCVLPKTMQES